MKRILFSIIAASFIFSCKDDKQTADRSANKPEDTVLTFRNEAGGVDISMAGGAVVNMYLSADSLNPFTWFLTKEQMPENNREGAGVPFRGHFLCLGRWGSPTPGEKKAGIPHNGEQTREYWQLESSEKNGNDYAEAITSCALPLDKMTVQRKVKIGKSSGELIFAVNETVTNEHSVGRLNNVVQHITLGAPFLNRNMIVNSNAYRGFNQLDTLNKLENAAVKWPVVKQKGKLLNIESTDQDSSYCASYIFDTTSSDYGWVTAYRPENGIVLGYIWLLKDYPWINVWHQMIDGKPWAKGLEFGTGGMGRDYRDLLENNTNFFGYNSFEWLDAGESVSKSYISFMLKAEPGLSGIEKIEKTDSILMIQFKNGSRREVNLGGLSLNP